MSQFPALKPSSRSFTPGIVPVQSFASMSGKETRVILGDTMHGHSISLSFSNLQEPAVKQITDHWYNRQGTALDFTLPADVWAGWSQYNSATTSGQKWRYTAQPQIEAVSPSIMNVSVELVSLA
nr:phage minor tail protein [uncultured Mediterranean phage uvMED]